VRPIVIAAGGTGGHFFPAEALAAELLARGHRIVLMTDGRSGALQSPVFAGHEHHVLQGAGIAGRGLSRGVQAGLALAAGTLQARRLLKDLDAAAIIGFGGYPCVPPVLAARSLRRRPLIVLHEQNAVLGRANRVLSRFADLLALGFAETARVPPDILTQNTGNPVRPAIRAVSATVYVPPQEKIELLVLGGSLGARIFSDVVPEALALLPADLRARLHVVQQCRLEDLVRVRAAYKAAAIEADLSPFFTGVAEKLAAAHIIIARAGASTCAEIAVVGIPSILVPLPGAIDDHQAANACALADSGAATVIGQQEFSAAKLAGLLSQQLGDADGLLRAAAAAKSCARPDAAADLASAVENLLADAEALP
jgi:UDP-N-acetylglucosamine--N-acetylmuramyl-(pentapeptide) pyrophosphoryl-undecaprenol N-acetylglucosamine transferase